MNTRSAFGIGFVLFFSLSVIVAPAVAQGDDADLIVFAAIPAGELATDIFTIAPDGSNLTQLTNGPDTDQVPRWSPDGAQILFTSNRDGNFEIYLMDGDGSNPTRLTDNPGPDTNPNFSPDGQYIAWASGPNPNMDNLNIWVMNADGSGKRQLTDAVADERSPRWLPDSRTIMYTAGAFEYLTVPSGTVDIEGNMIEGVMYTEAISPDGLLSLSIQRDWAEEGAESLFTPLHILVAPVNNPQAGAAILIEGCDLGIPSWSPDASQIVAMQSCPYRRAGDSGVDRITRLIVVNADGSNPHLLTEGLEDYNAPHWRHGPSG